MARRLVWMLVGCVLLATSDLLPAHAQGDADVHAVPATIDGDGGEDVTRALQRFFNTVPDGSTIQLRAGATYRVDGTLTLEGREHVTLDGNGATIQTDVLGDRNRSHLRIVVGSEIAVHDLVIRGANPAAGVGEEAYRDELEGQHGVEVLGTAGVELARLKVSDVFGDFIYLGRYLGPERDPRFATGAWIHDNRLTRSGRQGIAVTAARDVLIERNRISATRRASFDLEPNTESQSVTNVQILNNRVGAGRLLFVAAHGGGPVNGVVIGLNTLTRPLGVDVKAPSGTSRQDWWVVGNTSSAGAPGGTRAPLRFIRVDGVVVTDNTQEIGRLPNGVDAIDVCGLWVHDNEWGPGTEEVAHEEAPGRTCPEANEPGLPPIPAVYRTDIGEPPPTTVPPATSTTAAPNTTTPASTTSSPSTPTPTTTPTAASEDDGSNWIAVVVLVPLAAIGLALWARRRRRAQTNSENSST